MRTWYHSWRAAIRIARRDAWRAKGRSSLVLAMIALPILGVSAADVTLRSVELSAEQKLERSLGAADARVNDPGLGGAPLMQAPQPGMYSTVEKYDDRPYPEGRTEITKALPAGATSLSDALGRSKLHTEHGLLSTEIRELKSTDPMVKGIMALKKGRLPQKAEEVAATTAFLDKSGLSVGSKLTARHLDRAYTIVGAYELPGALKTDQINALPGSLLAPLDKALAKLELPTTEATTSYLVTVKGGFTWNMVKEANTKGVMVESRAVTLNPPADSEVPLFQQPDWQSWETSPAADAAALAAVATVVGLAILEICLLAGPAFAVGARRSRRQLGLVGANGGDRKHIRAIVLAGGLVIGVAAAVIGTVLGLLLTIVLRPILEDYAGSRFGGLDIRPLELLGIGALAVFTGAMAALVPAITSSRQPVLASLTGRRGIRRSSRVLPVIGLIAVALGAAIALAGSMFMNSFIVVGLGAAIAELGVVALTPALVGLFGRLGRFLPLSPRLALRDAVRNRGRTAPAVAAVLAAVAGTVAVATYAASGDAQARAQYTPRLPHGAVMVLDEQNGRDVPAIRSTVQRMLPVDVRADVDRIVVGKASCSAWETGNGCGRYEVFVPPAHRCPLDSMSGRDDPAQRYTVAERRKLAEDWRCKETSQYSYYGSTPVLVGGPKLLKALGISDPGAAKALESGKPIAFDKRYLDAKGKIGIRLITDTEAADKALEDGKEAPGVIKSFDTYRAPENTHAYGTPIIMPPAAAKAAGLSTVPYGAYYSTDRMPTSKERQQLDGELAKIGNEVSFHIEEGFVSETDIAMLALAVFAGLITIGAAGIATGLAQADAEADLKTLAAVGAPPRVRRTLSGFQCGVVALMGVVLGSAAGVLPSIGLLLTERRDQMEMYRESLDAGYSGTKPFIPIVMPWPTLVALLIAVPLGAALLAALVTRSRGALARRAAS
ncbi:FtsX-like permease family protein [Streptomyces sp. NPDC004609]|uniref:FtsX-like permease family protein n=1 Tax=Streptomyces sp. NPDC004609 TaxID=3364704 RepID=UPI0036CC84DE